jgi:methanogenic corrinoid protein MtbC1
MGLVRTIEHEVIPRLVRAHRNQAHRLHLVTDAAELGPVQVTELCACVLEGQQEDLLAYVRATRERGVSIERLYLELLAPVARRLGDMWMADECDFTAVTLGLSRLHSVVHQLSAAFQFDSEPLGESKRVLLAATPGEQHTFGLFMVAEFLRRAGWDIVDQPVASAQELTAAVRRDWFAVAGFSLARESGVDLLTGVIREVRRASRNRSIGILVGGVVFGGRPELVARVGADDWAADAPEAVRLADAVMARHEEGKKG